MSAAKRKRTANFSTNEKIKFLRILQKKGQVIINKVNTTDGRTNRQKDAAWRDITHLLNASGEVKVRRTTDNLKKLWQKMKTEVKKKQLNANNETGGEPSKKEDDPVLELVANITSSGNSEIEYVNCEYKEEKVDIVTPKSQSPIKTLWPTEIEVEAVPPESENDRLWPTEPEEIVTLNPKTQLPTASIDVVEAVAANPQTQLRKLSPAKDAGEVVAANPQTKLRKLGPAKVVVANVKPKTHTQLQIHLKRRWPSENDTGSKKDKLDAYFVNERLKCEREKGALIQLQKRHMTQEHALKIKLEELKTTILEVILKKIQDDQSVHPDLVKIRGEVQNFAE